MAAIDFGTHGSGYAWAVKDPRNSSAATRQIITEMDWPGAPTPTPKNLSALALSDDGKIIGWGFEARKIWHNSLRQSESGTSLHYHHAFKLGLIGHGLGSQAEADRTRELITSYLSALVAHALKSITSVGYVESDILWCLTVPAMWSDYQKQQMRLCAEAAGLPADPKRLIFALEPEAAAHYARVSGTRTKNLSGGRANLMSPRSRFMVVDCGGGTVDITSYRADDDNTLTEIGNDCGDACGSDYVNQAFVNLIVGSRFASWDRVSQLIDEAPSAFAGLVDAWEKEKLHVSYPAKDEVFIPIPAALHRRLTVEDTEILEKAQDGVSDSLILKAPEVGEIFEAVVPQVLHLVDKQLLEMEAQRGGAKAIETLVLVGGFGSSPYLRSRIAEEFSGRAVVITPPDPASAVLSGAVHFAFDPQVQARKTRFTYGVGISSPFIHGTDPTEKFFVGDDGEERCRDRFSLFVEARKTVKTGKPISHPLLPVFFKQSSMLVTVFGSRLSRPRYTDDPEVFEIGNIEVDLTSVMGEALKDRSVSVSMYFGETEIRIEAKLERTGETVSARLNFEPLG